MKYFYLGTSEVRWLGQANVPLFISHRRLAPRKSFPRALTGWALDSGGFTELSMYGQWRTTARDYNAAVWRYDQEIGNLQWASPGDWMCEPEQIARTGLSVREHQRRTIDNFQELQDLWPGPDWDVPYVPVLQGWTPDDYRRCVHMYYAAGVDLSDCFLVGVGTMCRRQASAEIDVILSTIQRHDPDIPLHAYGLKLSGLKRYGHRVLSADSMAWSWAARMSEPLPGHTHAACNNCLPYALAWRERVLDITPSGQMSLFDAA